MIGRKGKRPVVPRRSVAGQTKPRFVFDSGNKVVEKGSSGMKKAKGSKVKPVPSLGANPAKQPAPPCVKDKCEVDPDDASGSHIIHDVVYDAAGQKINLIAICPDVCSPGASDDEDLLFLPYPLDGAQEITSDDDPDLEIEYFLN